MGKRIRIQVDQVVAEAELFEDKAPLTTAALWELVTAARSHWAGR